MIDLHTLTPICKAISALFPGQVEVVLHDLKSGRISAIENGFSPREEGDDSLVETADYQSELLPDDTIGPYLKSNSDGARLRSVSALLRDEDGQPSALLCLNLRLTELEAARDLLEALTSLHLDTGSNLLKNDWREVTNSIVASTLKELKLSFNQLRRPNRLVIVERLVQADIFAARGSSEYVAEVLGISRASLYELIKLAKQSPATKVRR
ncbi:PAS domain-containing protein [uncultured Roseibium sp.]|uniref:helix-turn-helix transcriptional regulator n=1 Tax=uncultured Roseibium sp. TaxID=1936171 RepID=UPI002606A4F6|nr:PAS domain-containing protein [uncultured Roseibium sp.]